jgi:hypothetical protein
MSNKYLPSSEDQGRMQGDPDLAHLIIMLGLAWCGVCAYFGYDIALEYGWDSLLGAVLGFAMGFIIIIVAGIFVIALS